MIQIAQINLNFSWWRLKARYDFFVQIKKTWIDEVVSICHKKKESLCQENNAQPDPVSEKQKPWFHQPWVCSSIFINHEYVISVRYRKEVLSIICWFDVLQRISPIPPLLIRVTGHSPLSQQICVVLFCKSCMSSIGYTSAGAPHTHVEYEGGGHGAGVHTTTHVALSAKLTEPPTPELPHWGNHQCEGGFYVSCSQCSHTYCFLVFFVVSQHSTCFPEFLFHFSSP